MAEIGSQELASLTFCPDAETAYTDGRQIVCPLPPMDATYEDYQVLRGQVIHEVGHLRRPEIFQIVKDRGINMRSKLGTLLNQVEDRVQETITAADHVGDAASLDRLHSISVRKQVKMLADKGLPVDCNREVTHKLWAAMYVGIMGCPWLKGTAVAVHENLPGVGRILPETLTLIEELRSEGWGERINNAALSPMGALELARELKQRLFPGDVTVEEHPTGGAGSRGKGGSDAKDGHGVDGVEGDKLVVVPWHLLTLSDHDDSKDESKVSAHPQHIDWTGKTYKNRVPDLLTNISEVDEFSDRISPVGKLISDSANGASFPSSLVGEVRRRLQAKTPCKWRNEKLEGKLDTRSIGRLILPTAGDGTFNRAVFKQKTPGLKLDVSMSILVDSSGSMTGSKYVNASVAALALNELCQRALRIPSEILGFTHGIGDANPRMYIHKTFDQRAVSKETLARTLGSESVHLLGNSDAEAVMYAVRRLRKQRTTRKVLIVLSDGAPADAKSGGMSGAYDNLKKIVSLIRKAGDVELYGIGIQDTNVREFYSAQAPVVSKPAEVAPALLNVLNDVLQKQPMGGT